MHSRERGSKSPQLRSRFYKQLLGLYRTVLEDIGQGPGRIAVVSTSETSSLVVQGRHLWTPTIQLLSVCYLSWTCSRCVTLQGQALEIIREICNSKGTVIIGTARQYGLICSFREKWQSLIQRWDSSRWHCHVWTQSKEVLLLKYTISDFNMHPLKPGYTLPKGWKVHMHRRVSYVHDFQFIKNTKNTLCRILDNQ